MNTKRSDIVSASEIASWAFCPEAWRLAAIGEEPGNRDELGRGKAFHEKTAVAEVWTRRAVKVGLWLLALALVLAALGYLLLGDPGR